MLMFRSTCCRAPVWVRGGYESKEMAATYCICSHCGQICDAKMMEVEIGEASVEEQEVVVQQAQSNLFNDCIMWPICTGNCPCDFYQVKETENVETSDCQYRCYTYHRGDSFKASLVVVL